MKTPNSTWKTVPRLTIVIALTGVFFTFATVGFAGDSTQMGREPTIRFALAVILGGFFAGLYAVTGTILRKNWWKAGIPIFIVQSVTMNAIGRWWPNRPALSQMGPPEIASLQSRLTFNGIAIMVSIAIGYACFVYVSITEGRRYYRAHAEIALATEIHRVLVPPIDMKTAEFEFGGRSLPSGEVGGDLVDVFQTGRGWIAYIADVSGHGVAPGVLMGMVKSAARMQLSSTEASSALLEHLNSVLIPIKKPEMFVTFAYLAWDGAQLEYSLAGHPPILHYHAATREISEVSCSNLPLGMFGGQEFVRGSVPFSPGDLFVLLTDGLLETANNKDEEFGLAGIKAVLSAHAGNPLQSILQSILNATKQYGHTVDDQSLLLVQCRIHAA